MRIYLLFAVCLMATSILFGQAPTNELGITFPEPPEAKAFQKFGDNSLAGFTGTPGIGLPIATLTEGPLSLSVGLRYDASGLKVTDVSTCVGAGWSLDRGGMVSRQIRGNAADELVNGMWNMRELYGDIDCSGRSDHWQTIQNSGDSEADIFSFNFDGYSGKFYVDGNMDIVQIPLSDLKIEMIENGNPSNPFRIEQFIITTPNGIRYLFGSKTPGDNSAIATYSVFGSEIIESTTANTWYLARMETPDHHLRIDLDYVDNHYTYNYWSSYNDQINATINEMVMMDKGVSRIYSSTEEITFTNTIPRLDVGGIDRMKIDEIRHFTSDSLTSYCRKFDLTYDYFSDPNPDVGFLPDSLRLRLLSVQESACDSSIIIPPYTFEYYGNSYYPSRLNNVFDHWGYYNNGHTSSLKICQWQDPIPNCNTLSLITTCPDGKDSHGESMKMGTLKKVNYPTGGNTVYELEANEANITGQLVDVVRDVVEGDMSYESGNDGTISGSTCNVDFSSYQNYELRYVLRSKGRVNSVNADPHAKVFIRQSPGTCLGAPQVATLESFPGQGDTLVQTGLLSDLIPNFSYNDIYHFHYETYYAGLDFEVYAYRTFNGNQNVKIGGLRVKTITDSTATELAKVRSFEYQQYPDTSKSSGHLFRRPIYWYTVCNETDMVHSDSVGKQSVAPLRSFGGNHIAYDRIVENFTDNSSIEYKYYVEDQVELLEDPNCFWFQEETYAGITYDPLFLHPQLYKYPYPTVLDGMLKEKTLRDASGIGVYKESYDYNENEAYTIEPETFAKAVRLPSTMTYYYTYQMRTKAPLLLKKATYADGVSDTTTYAYLSNKHYFPTKEVKVNSDGLIHTIDYSYVFDHPWKKVRNAMIDRNMIGQPWETTKKVGSTLVSGTRMHYRFYDNATGAYEGTSTSTDGEPRIYRVYNYEKTWDANGNLTGPGWVNKGTVNYYDVKGFPARFNNVEWGDEDYTWQPNGQLKERKYLDYTWTYNYYDGTNLLQSIEDIDGQEVTSTYDQLMRLSNRAARNGNVSTDFTYHYANAADPHNWLHSKTTFASVNGSSFTNQESYTYLDGLGREMQTVQVKHSTDNRDVIHQIAYDDQGRVNKRFVPYHSAYNDGRFVDVPGFWKHTAISYEANPLHRVFEETPPDWYATETAYGSNSSGEVINQATGLAYAPGELSKLVVTDPNGNKIFNFTDKLGRNILSRRSNTDGTETADTYYEYDDKDRLIQVLPPDATATDTDLIYKYLYDQEDNLTYKKVPGQAAMTMLYNDRDLMTFMQDGNLAAQGKWMMNKYDDYGRPWKTGFYVGTPVDGNAGPGFTELLTENTYGTTGIEKGRVLSTETKILNSNSFLNTFYNYDAYGRVSSTNGNNHLYLTSNSAENMTYAYDFADNVLKTKHVHFSSASSSKTIDERFVIDHSGRLKSQFHKISGNSELQLADNKYNYRDWLTRKRLHRTSTGSYLQHVDYSYNQQGWMTAINNICTNAVLSDGTSDPIQGVTAMDLELSFEQGRSSARGTAPKVEIKLKSDLVLTDGQADHREAVKTLALPGKRTKRSFDTIEGGPQARTSNTDRIELNFASLRVDARQMGPFLLEVERQLKQELAARGLEAYTAQLATAVQTEIESLVPMGSGAGNASTSSTNYDNDLFAMKLTYDENPNSNLNASAQYNGNIATMTWQIACNNQQHYGFQYDFLDRMTNAQYVETDYPTNLYVNHNRYSVDNISYDKRGNIQTLNRRGLRSNGVFNYIDIMSYSYSGNQLTQVTEVNSPDLLDKGFKSVATNGVGSYTYDANGNMISDQHRDISNIEYNHLNLPRQITYSNGDWIKWTYDAAGIKLKKENSNGIVKNYLGEFEYNNTTLEAIYHSEGRAVPKHNPTEFRYEYSLRDHLGNTRITFSDLDESGDVNETEILQENHYYPFGMEMEGVWSPIIGGENLYQYNDKELNRDFGLNWLDYGARWYDAALGRFHTVDRFAEKYYEMTPYQYGGNNPISFIDINGDSIAYANGAKDIVDDARQASEFFDALVQILENSDVTYVFNFQGEKDYKKAAKEGEANSGSLTTDGEQVFINFNTVTNSTTDGLFTPLFHETEHGVQFEFGELGFRKVVDENGNEVWTTNSRSYDITDEINAFKAGFEAPGANKLIKRKFQERSLEQQMDYVGNMSDTYKALARKGKKDLRMGENPAINYPSVPYPTVQKSNTFFKSGRKRGG